jgi:tetratricopeptide (TPR) repeat protein
MSYLLGCWIGLIATSLAAADAPTLKEARQRLLRGNYAEARELYTTLAKEPSQRSKATVGLSRGWQSEGEYDRALEVIDTALKETPKDADLLAGRAELLYLRGRWDEAATAANAALSNNDEQFLARWVLAQVYRDRGELTKADEEMRWFVRTYSARSNQDKDITDPDELLLVGLAGLERARWHNLTDQFDFILNEVFADASKRDRDFWPANYEAGRLFLEKYNHASAMKAFNKALVTNPRAAEVLASKGVAALRRFDMKDAEQFVEDALKINPRLPEARRLKGDIYLTAGDFDKALVELEQARAVNPRDEATLARVATCFYLQHKDAEFSAIVKDVEAHNPRAGVFYAELGERLDERKRFEDSEKYFKLAIKLRPNLLGPQSSLGQLYMRMAREEEARPILEEAFDRDKFNVRVFNTLKVLDHLEKYSTLKTEHFLIRHDPKHDKVLAAFVGKYCEDIYADLAEKFKYRPKGPILIEVFNTHTMFSGRVVALPDLHTIGACTGRMVAMVSPHDKAGIIPKPFNWARVLRHELVHIFNLEQTNFQLPHWFTEGLAVSQEGFPMPPLWIHLLTERVPAGDLMNLDNIHLGFIRPSSSEDWNMAYLQSFQYVQYLKDAHGQKAVSELLDAYQRGLDTGTAIEQVCKVPKAEFEKGYRRHLDALVTKLGVKGPEKAQPRSLKALKEAHAAEPGNLDVSARLAEHYLLLGDHGEATKLVGEILEKNKAHPLAATLQARLYLEKKDVSRAAATLQAAVNVKAPDAKVLKLLGKLQLEAKKFEEAAQTFELGRKAEPYESTWLVQLARVYVQTKQDDKLIDVLKEVVPTNADDLDVRVKLCQLLLKAGRHAEAERYAREALEIDVLDNDAQETLMAALLAQKKDTEAQSLRKLLDRR